MLIFCHHLNLWLMQPTLPSTRFPDEEASYLQALLFKNILKETWEEAGYNKRDLFIHLQSKYTYIRINVKKP